MKVTLQLITQAAFLAFARQRRQPTHVWKAARSIMRCRTGALGAHIVQCPHGHVSEVHMNSCGHRACPQCWYRRMCDWLEACRRLVLPVAHFHVVFTIPSAFHDLWRHNRKLMAELLFRCVRETLFELLGDQRHLGARPGVIAALHTWGRTLSFHPHVHCLVSAGGLDDDGQWIHSRNGFLIPGRVARVVFAAKMLSGIEQLWSSSQLVLPHAMHDEDLRHLLIAQATKKWNVRIDAGHGGARAVIGYLSRYLRGGPVKNHRLLAFDGVTVAMKYRPIGSPSGTHDVLCLSVNEFLRRWAEHVPPHRLHMVRRWGLYSSRSKADLITARLELTGLPQCDPSEPDSPPLVTINDHCPTCHAKLIRVEIAPRPGAPPQAAPLAA